MVSVVYLALTACFSIALTLLEIDSNSSATITALIGAAMVEGSKFIQDHKRAPNPLEKTKLVWLSYLTTWLVSLVLLGGFVMATNEESKRLEVMRSISIGIIDAVIVFFSIVVLGTLTLSYGLLARKQLKSRKKKGAI
ncbi:MAG: ABZJ_00895 family protein [Candidatus Thiodiazotropha taylori]